MSTVKEIEGAITELSSAEWNELREWIRERERTEAANSPDEKVDWSQSPSISEPRDPTERIPAQMILDVLDELRR